MNAKHSRLSNNPHRGFGMVEILVAVVIAMLASLVVMQIATTFEAQKRSTSGSADAQTNGAIALYAVGRQAQLAGFGLPLFNGSYRPMRCTPAPLLINGRPLIPVTVTDGANGAPDSLIIRGARLDPPLVPADSLGGVPMLMSVPMAGSTATFLNNMGCRTNDVAIVIRNRAAGTNCLSGTVQISSAPAPGGTQITLSGMPGFPVGGWTPGGGDAVICMPNWTETNFTIAGNQLLESINGAAPPTMLASEVISMQIQYGIALTGPDPAIASWVEPTGTWAAGAISANDQRRIRALRIAVITRNETQEKDDVTSDGMCGNRGTTPLVRTDGVCAWQGVAGSDAPAVNIETGNPDWAKYRYSVHEMVVPLRNMIMNATTL